MEFHGCSPQPNRKGSSGYDSWRAMKKRCYNPKNNRYKYYGARGIIVCERWKDSFVEFLKDMGPKPSNEHSLDRVDVNGNYEPSNCRWATQLEQQNNKRQRDISEFCDEEIKAEFYKRSLDRKV